MEYSDIGDIGDIGGAGFGGEGGGGGGGDGDDFDWQYLQGALVLLGAAGRCQRCFAAVEEVCRVVFQYNRVVLPCASYLRAVHEICLGQWGVATTVAASGASPP